jgi:diguanylate cyclase (GGDEF)-like protein
MRPVVTPAATNPSAIADTPTVTGAFGRRLRALRYAVIAALIVAVPLVVVLATRHSDAGMKQAYGTQARADARAVARATAAASDHGSRASVARQLEQVRGANPDVGAIAVYRKGRLIAHAGGAAPAALSGAREREQRTGRAHLIDVGASSGRGTEVVLTWNLARADKSIAAQHDGFPLGLTIALVAAALIAYALIHQFGFRRLARLADELAEGQESLATLALEDPLTGLPNKRAFTDRLEAELGRAAREYYPVSIVAMDLDKFKQINDTWGHAVGDEALTKIAKELQNQLRAGDICARLGGDEFMLALVRADTGTAEKVLERLKAAVARLEVGPDRHKIKFSAGIAEFPRHSTDGDAVIEMADAALYVGKAQGRDRWHVYTSDAASVLGDTDRAQDGARRRNMLATLQQLAKAVDAKNRFTQDHSDRVAGYAAALATSLKLHDARVEVVRTAGLLHDVGKIGVPTPVLIKEAPLNLDDLDQMARHSELGRAMIAGAGMPEEARIVFHVHERWDGGGFPDGLVGEAIPIESRILHAADSLDRATRPTAHRKSRPLREALAELEFSAGTKLDPEVTARMISMVRGGEIKIPGADEAPLRVVGDRRQPRAATG